MLLLWIFSEPEMQEIISQIFSINPIKDVLIPISAALLGLWIATRKFKHERIWQEKYAAYQRVLESIEVIRYWGDEMASDAYMEPTVNWYDGKSPNDFYASAEREIVKQISIGTILLSKNFTSVLSEFYKELYKENYSAQEIYTESYHEYQHDSQAAVIDHGRHAAETRNIADKYLPTLVKLARKDLGVNTIWQDIKDRIFQKAFCK